MPKALNLSVDVAAIQDIAQRGVRRAAAFLGLGLSAVREGPPSSVTLEGRFLVQCFPDPLPAAAAAELAKEYEAWIIGSALRELDLQFALFLDRVWECARSAEFHNRQIPSDFAPDKKFTDDTNVSRKLHRVEGILKVKGIGSDFFHSYSLARNALSHNAGIVRPRDANQPGALSIRWHAPSVIIKANGNEHIFDQQKEFSHLMFGVGAQPVFRMSEQGVVFAVGRGST